MFMLLVLSASCCDLVLFLSGGEAVGCVRDCNPEFGYIASASERKSTFRSMNRAAVLKV